MGTLIILIDECISIRQLVPVLFRVFISTGMHALLNSSSVVLSLKYIFLILCFYLE